MSTNPASSEGKLATSTTSSSANIVSGSAPDEPDARFPCIRRKAYKQVRSATEETVCLRIPWGPRFSVIFDPRNAPGIASGKVIVYALAESAQYAIESKNLLNATDPVLITGEAGCDSFLVTARLGTPPPPGAKAVESFVYATTYAGVK